MKRSRIQQQRHQEEGLTNRSTTPSVPLVIPPRSYSYPSSSSSQRLSPPRMKLMSIEPNLDDFDNLPPHRYIFKLISILSTLGFLLWTLRHQSEQYKMEGTQPQESAGNTNTINPSESSLLLNDDISNQNRTGSSISIAHLGNSIQYYNDCPRMLQNMLYQTYEHVTHDSCLRGGANLTSLWERGNGMEHKFATPTALRPDGTHDIGSPTVESLLSSSKWDFVVINDHTQAPVRPTNKTDSTQTLREKYIPLLQQHNPNATVVLLMTAAYRAPAKNSSDLGDFDNFTQGLVAGYQEYATLFSNNNPVKICPLGLAYQYVREHNDTAIVKWETLYAWDDFHPSPHGTYLEACMLYCTITNGKTPPDYNIYWWSRARYMQPTSSSHAPMALPTKEEANYLRTVAMQVCQQQQQQQEKRITPIGIQEDGPAAKRARL